MENNFGGGFNKLPNQGSFQRRTNFGALSSNSAPNSFNRTSQNITRVSSLDGRSWESRDQAIVANKEYYKKIGREINHKKENPDAFNLNNFYRFNKD